MDLDCLSQNMSIICLHDYQKSANICGFCTSTLKKHFPNPGDLKQYINEKYNSTVRLFKQ